MLVESVSNGSVKNLNDIKPEGIQAQGVVFSEIKDKVENVIKQENKQEQANLSQISGMAKDLQNKMQVLHNVAFNFSVHENSGRIMVSVINEDTGDVIRQIPSEEILNLSAKLEEAIGLIFDKKA